MIKVIIYYEFMKTLEISDIDEMLQKLSDERLQEVRDFVGYLIEREKKHQAFVERVLKAEQEHDSIICNSVEEAMQAILNAPDEDDEA
jgi:Mn-containing catalase